MLEFGQKITASGPGTAGVSPAKSRPKMKVIVYRIKTIVIPAFFSYPLDKSFEFCYGKVDECIQGQPPARSG